MPDIDAVPVRKSGERRRPFKALTTVVSAALVAAGLTFVGAPQAALAADPLSCVGSVYLTDGTNNQIKKLDLATGDVSGPVFTTPANQGTATNQLGVSPQGADLYYGTTTSIVRYNAASGNTSTVAKPNGVANGQVGAVNPLNGLFYYGSYTGADGARELDLYVYTPGSTTATAGQVARISIPDGPGANGDIAFDKIGRLYLVNASGGVGTAGNAALYVANGELPVTPATPTPTLTATRISTTAVSSATNGIAFGSDGYLYLGSSGAVQKANPVTGAAVGNAISLSGKGLGANGSTDLGTCANPSTAQAGSSFPDGTVKPGDSSTVAVGGGSYTDPGTPATGTNPSFPPATPQPDGGSKTNPPAIVLPGETYTIVQNPNGSTNLGNYTTTWECRDTNGLVVANGTGNTAKYAPPTGTDGTSVVCTFINNIVPPTATADTQSVVFGTRSVVLPGATNDTAGSTAINAAATVFTSAQATNGGKRLETAQGVWTLANDGQITFVPVAGFVGTASTTYRVTDANGKTSDALATVTVRPGPDAQPDATTTPQGVAVTLTPLGNDTPGQNADGTAGTIAGSTVLFNTTGQPQGAIVSSDRRTLTVANEGTYVIDASTGAVTFTPVSTFHGVAKSVGYGFTDSHGNSATSTITITVTEVNPVAANDTATTTFGKPVTVNVGGNDSAGPGGAIDPTKTVFTSAQATDGGKTLTTAEGTWKIGNDGQVTFTPAPGYSGTTRPVEYQITDQNGQTATATVSVTVRPGPTATNDDAATQQNVDVSFNVLNNDAAGLKADGSAGTLDPNSFTFSVTPNLPTGSSVSTDGKTLTVTGEGVYTFDPSTAQVTFNPDASYSGTTTPITYTVADQDGNTASATITVKVTAVTPAASDDAAQTPGKTPVNVPVLANDQPGLSSVPLVPSTLVFTSPQATDGGKTLVTAEGTWTVQGSDVRFVPNDTYTGITAPVQYEVRDTNGTPTTADIVVTVGSAAVASSDSSSTLQGQPTTFPILGNDTPSNTGTPGTTGTFVPGSVVFPTTGQPAGATVSNSGRTITVPGEGVYMINAANGAVTFTPEPAYRGTTSSVTYRVSDTNGATAAAQITVVVTGVDPRAADDSANTPFDTAVNVPLLDNDSAGSPTVPLDAAKTIFTTANQPNGAVVAGDGKTITVPGEGTYKLDASGAAVFTPEPGYTGTTSPVTYRIEDANGTTDEAVVRVTVRTGPQAQTDQGTTRQGGPVTITPLSNDTPSRNADDTAGTWDAGSVTFPTTGQPNGAVVTDNGKTITVPGEGVYTVAPNGEVTFTPDKTFNGVATPVTYTVIDSKGNTATSTITVTVTAVVPTAGDDSAFTPFNTPVTFGYAANDTAGDPSVPLDSNTAVFEPSGIPAGVTAEIRDNGKTLVVTGEGTYVINAVATVTFTPADGYVGKTTPVRYTVSDTNGTKATAALTVTVQPGAVAVNDTDRTPQNTPVTVAVLGNDNAGLNADGSSSSFDINSLIFPPAAQSVGTVSDAGKKLTVANEGVYTIGADGRITFTPLATFRGAATPVPYQVTNGLGQTVSGTVAITVVGVEPVSRPDNGTTTSGKAVTIDVLGNDTGATGAPLDASTLQLIDGNGNKTTQVTVAGQGTWKVDNGKITFTPVAGFTGTATITYSVADVNGTEARSTVSVTVVKALPATGMDIPWAPLYGGVLMLILGGIVLYLRRRAS